MQSRRTLAPLAAAVFTLAPATAFAQALDVCGCAGSATSFGAFSSNVPSTHPPGTTVSGAAITIPLPADGVMVFNSFTVSNTAQGFDANVVFARNAANTPVTLLVRGNVTIQDGDIISLNGGVGSNGTAAAAGVGGQGGPGGFVGGDAAYQLGNLASDGGAGIGPGGGLGATAAAGAGGAIFLGLPELRPLVGGSGGGGGRSTTSGSGCSGGGGGGGGGALLIAANGTISISTLSAISANGANGGTAGNSACSSNGNGGSGGAIRLVANAITGTGSLRATGGTGAGAGVIRMEAIENSYGTNTIPVALRFANPQPLVDPLGPAVRIARVQGANTPANPVGFRGQIDMIVPSPGLVQLDIESQDVPTGTDVLVTVKPKIGGAPASQRVTLAPADCIGGTCVIDATFDLTPGAYIAEARATFEVP